MLALGGVECLSQEDCKFKTTDSNPRTKGWVCTPVVGCLSSFGKGLGLMPSTKCVVE